VRLVYSRPRDATLVPDDLTTYIVGTTTESLPFPASLTPSSSPTSGLDPVPSPTMILNSAPSVSYHPVEALSPETLSMPNNIASPLINAPIPSPLSPSDTTLPSATPAFNDDALSEPIAEQSAAKTSSKLKQWWLAHRKDIVSDVQTVLELTSKALDDIPAGGSIAAKALELGASALERVQVMLAHR
jgi:hypothetical protein